MIIKIIELISHTPYVFSNNAKKILLLFLFSLTLGSTLCFGAQNQLSSLQKEWLEKHPVIRIGIDVNYAPYSFIEDGKNFNGVAIEFIYEIEKYLGIRFELVPYFDWSKQINAIKNHEIDVLATAVKLQNRESFLEFSKIYLPTPLVIMTRVETPTLQSLDELKKLQISLVKEYSSSQQLMLAYPKLTPRYATSSLEGLRAVSSGMTDAYIGVLATSTFLAQGNGISNLKVNTAFDMKDNGQCFGVRKDWKELAFIIDTALLNIPEKRKNDIFHTWLAQDINEIKHIKTTNYETSLFPWLLAIAGLALLGYIVTSIWNRQLKEEILRRTQEREEMYKSIQNKEEIMMAQSRHAAMGEMISMIAHQWRQPIAAISMEANNLIADVELGTGSDASIREYSNKIIHQTAHLSQTINDFRDFFRPNKETEEIRLEDILKDVEKIIGKDLENSNIELKIKHQNGVKIKTYSREILQVYLNLLKNAKEVLVEKREKNRYIEVTISNDEKNIISTVCDNGGGIDETIISKIFDPYFSTKEAKNGTGLGLYMSKTIIEKHLNGTIEVYNTTEGACFKITLPRNALQNSPME